MSDTQIPQSPILLKVADVAGMLSCSTQTVRRMLADGELDGIKVRSTPRIYRSSVDAYLERHRGAA